MCGAVGLSSERSICYKKYYRFALDESLHAIGPPSAVPLPFCLIFISNVLGVGGLPNASHGRRRKNMSRMAVSYIDHTSVASPLSPNKSHWAVCAAMLLVAYDAPARLGNGYGYHWGDWSPPGMGRFNLQPALLDSVFWGGGAGAEEVWLRAHDPSTHVVSVAVPLVVF